MTAPTRPTCARCGETVTPGARFCMKCGSDVSGEQGSVATAMMPAAQEKDASDQILELLRTATIGEYEIHRELGRGGMATVYLAHDIALDRKVAIKVMSPALLLMGDGMSERFKREARTAANLSHPHIIPIYTVKSAGKTLFFVMKFIAGRSLEAIIKDLGPMPIPMAKAILQQVGNALGYAHRHGIVHRDVKPANIMIDEEGWSVVTDFGIAKVAENRALTMTGIAVGTPSYMSPEQCAAKDITGKSDQYSLGVVAYEMLTGKQPFEGDSAMSIMFAHFHEQPKPVIDARADCPPELAAAVMRMLEKAPDKRFPSMEEATVALGGLTLAHDDPIRLRLIELAKKGGTREILKQVPPPPTSPVPPAKTRAVVEAATTPIPAPRVIGISVAPGRSDLHVGDGMQLTATPRSAGGTAAAGKVEWSSSDAAIATVSPTGMVTAIAPGAATITASCEGVSGAAQVTVTPVPVAVVLVEPVDPVVAEGETMQLRATLRDAHGATLHGREISWKALPAGVASVSAAGLVTAIHEGVVEVVATSEGISGNSRIAVTVAPVANVAITPASPSVQSGEALTLEATLTDRHGKKLAGREIRWRSSSEPIATVSNRGVVTGHAEGTAEIIAVSEEKQAAAQVRVTAAPVTSVTIIEPKPLIAGDTLQLQAVLKDARGTVLTGRTVKWTSSSPGLATVTRDGHLTGMAPGSAKITAESEGKSWTITVTVLPVPAASIAIEGKTDPILIGASATLSAVVRDEKGRVLPGRDVSWSSSVAKVATVSGAGVVTARAAGDTVITATVEGRKAEVRMSVAAPAPAPAPKPELSEAATGVVARDEIVPPPAVPPRVAVAEAKTEVIQPPREPAPVTQPEVVERAPAPAASSGGLGKLVGGLVGVAVIAGIAFAVLHKRGTGSDDVPPPPALPLAATAVSAVEIVGNEATLGVGRTEQFAARLTDASGAELSGRSVTWSSTDPGVAEVSPIGAVTARKAGTATIVALSEGKADSFNVAVEASAADQPAAVAGVTVTGGGKALEVGETVQLQAALRDAKGAAIGDRTIVWATSDPQVVLVSSAGLVSAVGPGAATVSASSEGKSAEARLSVNAPKPQPKPPEPKPVEPQPAAVVVASIAITPSTLALVTGAEAPLAAVVLDEKRRPLGARGLTWKSSDDRIARVSSDGLVSAVGKGKATITASSGGKTASATVTVTEATVAVEAVVLTPAAKSLKVGETSAWSAIARDGKGKDLADRSILWTSSAPQIASVSARGAVTAVAAGSADIRAEAEGKSASERVTVFAPPPPPVASNPKPNPPPVVTPAAPATTPATATGNAALLPRRSVEAGGAFSCGIAQNGAVCWGAGAQGLTAIEGTSGITDLTMGRAHACGLLSGGRAVCWGDNKQGQLGDGTVTSTTSAVAVAGGLSFSALSAGGAHTCGLSGGKVYCWGKGKEGQLGDGSGSDRRKPVAVNSHQSFVALSAGGSHTCALTAAGKAFCWGDGFSGQLGFGGQEQQVEPIDVSGSQIFTRIAAGGKHTCGLTNAGKAYCWGSNESGQVGDGSKDDRPTPQAVGTPLTFRDISAGGNHSCALTSAGEAYCWGENRAGQLGDGSRTDRPKPTAVSGGAGFTSLSAGDGYTCGVGRNGEPLCWGRNDRGQLGDGGTTPRANPGPVRAD